MSDDGNRKPAVILDDVHVTYKVFATGKVITTPGRMKARLSRRAGVREVKAVRGVSLVFYEGESVGIIGSNGSGKSTLMRAIAGLEPLAKGVVYASSRPALLGVGAALMPKLSGVRNIILGGLALGFRRREIIRDIDAITEFAGLQEFIDLPMSTYSSGMSARLRFAIAAHRHHEILIIDEALAVGDAEFRNKAESRVQKMRDDAGTIFIVSHSMGSIRSSCNRCIWLDKGVVRMDGSAEEVTRAYEERIGGKK